MFKPNEYLSLLALLQDYEMHLTGNISSPMEAAKSIISSHIRLREDMQRRRSNINRWQWRFVHWVAGVLDVYI